jgi:predicted phage tail protein
MTLIRGALGGGKGGGGGGGTPSEAKDSLDSKQFATVIDLLSEGEIQGLKDGLKSVFLNNTPLQDASGSFNFKDVLYEFRTGTQDQDYIRFRDESGKLIGTETTDEQAVGVTVKKDTPVIRTITDRNTDAIAVTLSVPVFQIIDSKGNIKGANVEYKIEWQYNGNGFGTNNQVINGILKGRTGDQYERRHIIQINGDFPVDVKITRLTDDSTSSKVTNDFVWLTYAEIIYDRLRYPNSALIALRVNAEQFNSVPDRSYLIRGIKTRIPDNATVNQADGSLTYSGIWTGNFKAAEWNSDPAWALWDLLISTRYGFGDHILTPAEKQDLSFSGDASRLDKWSFFAASQYANEKVPTGRYNSDGTAILEPRFSCNINIQTQDEAFKLINDMCSVFRAMPYWSTGSLTISQDRPENPAYLFTLANITKDGFSYSSSSLKTRPTVVVVSYFDIELRDIAKEVVEDRELVEKYGVVTKEISAFACNSRSQARRMGLWMIYSEWREGEIVNFVSSADAGVIVRPGQVIEIADPVRDSTRRAGRIASATSTRITADDLTGLTIIANSRLSVIMPTGLVESRTIEAVEDNSFVVTVPFSSAPSVNSIWMYESSSAQRSSWRVLSIEERDGIEYSIAAISYNSSKYDYVERGEELEPRQISDLSIVYQAPKNIQTTEKLYNANGRVLSKIIVTWKSVSGVKQYRIRWREPSGNWNSTDQPRVDYEILDAQEGEYEIEVYSLNAALVQSASPARARIVSVGKTAPPEDPTGLTITPVDESTAVLAWNLSNDLDVTNGGAVLIRHNPALVSATWEAAQEIVSAAAGSQTQKQVPLLEGTYFIKFEDDGGRRSANYASIVVDLPEPQPRLLVETLTEHNTAIPFNGSFGSMLYLAELSGIVLDNAQLIDETVFSLIVAGGGTWDSLPSIDSYGGLVQEGEYVFAQKKDMGHIYDVDFYRILEFDTFAIGTLWDDQQQEIDTWATIDYGQDLDRPNVKVFISATNVNPATAVEADWGPWRELSNSILTGRGFRFFTQAKTLDVNQNIVITQLGARIELQQRTERSSAILESNTSAPTITFTSAFYQAPSVGVTAYDLATGDYYEITNVTTTGFDITFRNAAGTALNARKFTYTAVGYGKRISPP